MAYGSKKKSSYGGTKAKKCSKCGKAHKGKCKK